MAFITKLKIRSWMVIYLGFAVALVAAGSGQGMSNRVLDMSPAAGTSVIIGDTVFFAPAGVLVRRNDI